MSDNTDPDDIYSPRGSCPPPTEPSSSQKFSDLHGAKDKAIDQTPDVEASNPENEPEPLSSESPRDVSSFELPLDLSFLQSPMDLSFLESPLDPSSSESPPDPSISESPPDPSISESPPDPSISESPPDPSSSESPPDPSISESPLDPSSSESPPEPLNVEDLPGATTAPEHPTPKDRGPGSVPSPVGPNDPARTSCNEQDTKPAAGSDKGEKVQSFIRDATLPFRWMCGILLRKHVIKFIAILFGLFVLLPIAITLGVYGLSHAPSYVSNQILGKGYEFGNPFGALYPTWMPSWGSSQHGTVPKMHVAEEAQEPSPLTFRRPIPQVETDILPEVILSYEERLAGTNHENKVALLDDLAQSKKRAQDQKKFNQNFIDDMEAWSNLQYRHLQALVGRVDLILKELSGKVAGGTAAEGGGEWRWWESRATARQKTLQRNFDWLNSIIDNINKGVSTRHEDIVSMMLQDGHVSGLKKEASGSCWAMHTLRYSEDPEARDLAAALKIVCSSERRTGERWRHVQEAIEKFQRLQERARQMFNNRSNHYGDLEHAYRDIKALAMALMGALEEFARLSEEDEG
ncbi:hypothetical protein CDV36_003452 [Fusarium kuroshium]|uniref:Uncharacterized protein n=1 Tax=Fusarium kuroshium TaxID=2010991 RepID=A0A3M2SGZ1_9HYPO|nr:hypothetical protein CDV36_003452 [Fusarium kuroshium]